MGHPLTKTVWTLGGKVDYYILFFVHIGTRRVTIAGVTTRPHPAWVAERAREVFPAASRLAGDGGALLIDRDSSFGREFDAVFGAANIEVKRVGPMAPNMNAYAERWAQSVQQECLDHFVVFGEKHLRHLLVEYVEHFNHERPHQAVGNRPLFEGDPRKVDAVRGVVVCHPRLGGLLRHYERLAA